jgi:hypothetical protein
MSVNGTDPRGKPAVQLEALFSSRTPAPMTLSIERDGIVKKFSFRLRQATTILQANQHQLLYGKVLPAGVTAEYFSCFQ